MESGFTTEPHFDARPPRVTHYAHAGWRLVSAVVAVIAGFSTLNMTLADSGLASLNEQATPFTSLFARLLRQS
jgi:hypothetical protein